MTKNTKCKSSKRACKSKVSLGEKLTTVKTVYARAVMLLLTLNFALTGYAVYSITQIQATTMSSPEDTQAVEVIAQSASTE
jgi:hypothetical protein